jgi:hypothetical protein
MSFPIVFPSQFKMRLLEAANMELEEHTLLRDNLIKGRESTLAQLSEQLTLQDRIIRQQRELLEAAGVAMPSSLTADLSAYDAEAERPHDIVRPIIYIPRFKMGTKNEHLK